MTPLDITIERYVPGDEQGIIDVIVPIQREEFGIDITPEDQPDLMAIPSFYQAGKGDFWVARAQGRVIGTISMKDIGNDEVALRKMFVAAAWRGREFGVAKRLLECLMEAAAARGVTRIYLGTTAKFLAAHRFYEKHGFELIEPTDLPASFPLMAVDTRFYAYTV
ncbi:GNAT family N-acetyltransferase [Pseudomonas sp. GD03842]|uniref:GNAT family N-acetyltransferase n=1 Tax=unclassified Pseudomonas TaxID=196821 RepID=UPI000D3377CB|nr:MULTISPECIES: GNAT family N-acetyltransferase [unclassified Pseudomonas]MDH0749299.1 GNAT family N-acetyltransferase [Pseudomonas sp. GD03842]RAU45826.1 N-acetyltransferase [Pseudomonas sp. RIT 409]RAU56075.1 N-acetyltransferase [Pseudomonas sp. RIT 412]